MEEPITLADGLQVAVRAIQPDDVPLLQRFAARLSPRTVYQRFGQHLRELSPVMLARFTNLQPGRERALVALEPPGGEFIAVGRYAPNADGRTAEFALTVADAWQGRGIGSALMERLCEAAARDGYEALYAHILGDNRDMLDLASRFGFTPVSRAFNEVTVMRSLDRRQQSGE
jgi:acetyltransferase